MNNNNLYIIIVVLLLATGLGYIIGRETKSDPTIDDIVKTETEYREIQDEKLDSINQLIDKELEHIKELKTEAAAIIDSLSVEDKKINDAKKARNILDRIIGNN